MTEHELSEWQVVAWNLYANKFGLDAAVKALEMFEQTGNLGEAMIAC